MRFRGIGRGKPPPFSSQEPRVGRELSKGKNDFLEKKVGKSIAGFKKSRTFAASKQKQWFDNGKLGYGVMVTQQILVLFFQVRVLVSQQKVRFSANLFLFAFVSLSRLHFLGGGIASFRKKTFLCTENETMNCPSVDIRLLTIHLLTYVSYTYSSSIY